MTTFRRIGRGRTSSRRGFRPQTDWASALAFFTLSGAGDCVLLDLSTSDPEELRDDPETVRRIRGSFSLQVAAGASAVGGSHVAIGIGVVSAEAAAVTAVPCPVTNASWDGWLYHSGMFTLVDGSSTLIPQFNNVWTLGVDSRAQRRLEDNHLVLIAELYAGEGPDVNVATLLRWLLPDSGRR